MEMNSDLEQAQNISGIIPVIGYAMRIM